MEKAICFLLCCYLVVSVQVAGYHMHMRPPQSRSQLQKPKVTYYCTTPPYPLVSPEDLKQALQEAFQVAEQKIQAALDQDKAPGGASVGFVYRDTLIWSKGFGLIDMKDPSRGPPTESTGFRIGSITKILTALMTLILRDEGSLHSLDNDVSQYNTQFTIRNLFKTGRGITFRQLMSHMSGLPRTTPCEDLFVTGCTLSDEEIYKNLAQIELLYPPGKQPVYSNLGFGLLGRSLEKITMLKWEESVQKMVFEPLGMVDSGNTFTKEDIDKLALGYYKDGSQAGFVSMGWDAPAGQTYASVVDLSKLLMLVFRDDQPVNKATGQILDGETIREWLGPAYIYPNTGGFSYPWEILPVGNYSLRTKDGRINGYMSEIQMATEIKTGFVFLHSCDGCLSHYDIIGILQEVILQTDAQLVQLQPPRKAPSGISDYVGQYSAVVDGTKDTIYINTTTLYGGPILTFNQDGNNLYLQWDKEDSFQVSYEGVPGAVSCYDLHDGHIGQRVYFQREAGAIVSFTLPGTVYGKVYKKSK